MNALNIWGLRFSIGLVAAVAAWDLWRHPGLFGAFFLVFAVALFAWWEYAWRAVNRRAEERAWATAALSPDPVRSLAVSAWLRKRSLREISVLAEWHAQGRSVDDPDAPPMVRAYHQVLTHEPPREP